MTGANPSLIASVRRQRDACALLGSPLYAGLLDRLADDAEAGGPTRGVLEPFAGWPGESVYVLRIMGAVHRLVLTGDAPALAPHFAPGGDAAAAWAPFAELLGDRGHEVGAIALARGVQTNEVGRCAALAPAILRLAGDRPLRLLELGASAGLNLRWDEYSYEGLWGDPASPVALTGRFEGEPPPFEPAQVEVVERRGCDANPLDPVSEEGRLTLLSYVWPDQEERMELLRGALEVAARVPVRVEGANAADWIERALDEPTVPDAATVVFHSIFWQYLAPGDRARIEAALERAGARATAAAPLVWLRMEADGDAAKVDAITWPGRRAAPVARAGYHGRPVRWLA